MARADFAAAVALDDANAVEAKSLIPKLAKTDRICSARLLKVDRAGTSIATREKSMRREDQSFANLLVFDGVDAVAVRSALDTTKSLTPDGAVPHFVYKQVYQLERRQAGRRLDHFSKMRLWPKPSNQMPSVALWSRFHASLSHAKRDWAAMGIIWTIIIGFVAGVIAKFIMPGPNEPSGFISDDHPRRSSARSLRRSSASRSAGIQAGEGAGFIGAIVGAIIVLVRLGHGHEEPRRHVTDSASSTAKEQKNG